MDGANGAEVEARDLTQEEAFARIRLLRSPHVGPVSYRQLLSRFATATAALEALPDLAGKAGKRYAIAPVGQIHAEAAAMRKAGARYLFHDSPEYPPLLAAAPGAPPILTCRGNVALLHRPCVAMVGARNASAAAVRLARDFAHGLAQAGYTVVSGLARGIDGAAHEGALAAGGATVGVIASGIDIAYPPQHAELHERIAEKGLLLAEQPPGAEPLARHFPARNRIIAGLSAGTLVVEAAPKSGSLITARLAGEMGREVMAIPGSPLDPRAHGCNGLIRDGAVLVQSVEDVRELLTAFDGLSPRSTFREENEAWDLAGEGGEPASDDNPAEVAALLTTAPVGVDELIRQSGASAASVQLALLELELAGRLVRHAGGRVSLS
ncbi:DNA-processing protein DprA [Novosphingobium sp. 1949]|uniref:DNA-processing protein DprA n=1 Tax=Novosphingobium organovorum TaxID=2930092 RepID=A0ABT0BB34_9SPHN|nr:DNA-processing protein DprA [Novosphingobium organovorum]MCJ2182272.1 DNA-processing protein DprA [Novosphingobium organovorum]